MVTLRQQVEADAGVQGPKIRVRDSVEDVRPSLGLTTGTDVSKDCYPDKRVFRLTTEGEAAVS